MQADKQAIKCHVDQLELHAQFIGQSLGNGNVKSDNGVNAVDFHVEFIRRVVGRGSDNQLAGSFDISKLIHGSGLGAVLFFLLSVFICRRSIVVVGAGGKAQQHDEGKQ